MSIGRWVLQCPTTGRFWTGAGWSPARAEARRCVTYSQALRVRRDVAPDADVVAVLLRGEGEP